MIRCRGNRATFLTNLGAGYNEFASSLADSSCLLWLWLCDTQVVNSSNRSLNPGVVAARVSASLVERSCTTRGQIVEAHNPKILVFRRW